MAATKSSFNFPNALLSWFDIHGRKNLPWQHPLEPYRVWLSEVMLQQTQVETVIPYFHQFVTQYPNIHALASANLDDVLHLWTGLGYYARARNLHACAQAISTQYRGIFPSNIETLKSLPGIGPSTAAAIASIAFEQPTAILDGNVKRVLTRFHAINEWPGTAPVHNKLWGLAQQHMPTKRCRDYTQAIMDLGATLCKRSKPDCERCPMVSQCQAYKLGTPTAFPVKKASKTKPTKHIQMLVIKNTEQYVLLEQRPTLGIWGGLWSLPELATDIDAAKHVQKTYGKAKQHADLDEITHVFSHYTLKIQPRVFTINKPRNEIMESVQILWYNPHAPQKVGLAAPVKKLLMS